MTRMAWVTYIFPVTLLLLWAWMRDDITGPNLPAGIRAFGRLLEIMMGGMLLIAVLAVLFTQQAAKRTRHKRIGADPTHLLYDPGTGKIERYEWSSVLTDKFQLLMGRRLLPLTQPSGIRQLAVFPADRLRALLLPRLPATSFVGRARLQWSALRRGNLSLWAMCGVLLAMLVLQLLRKLHPEWFIAAGALLIEWLRASVS
jgi:hypothetical protein